nr:arginine deiminase-related protein [uncultured Bacteroides sp.]
MQLRINNETSTLRAVVLGQPGSIGKTPTLEETYDAKSYESVVKGIYPKEEDIFKEMSMFERVLTRYNVQVYRPWTLENCNQIFARDVGFVINDKIIVSNIIPDREDEKEAYETIYNQIAYNKIFNLPEKAHVEGGDVVLYNDMVFVGLYEQPDYRQMKTARTNRYALNFLQEICPEKTFIPFELKKHNTDPGEGILHLDCTLMPVGHGKAIVYKDGFLNADSYKQIVAIFGHENLFEITRSEMYHMYTNVFSLSPTVVVSEERFERLNRHLEDVWGFTVERVPYYEISKMGGLLRCSTLPLVRDND